MNKTIYEEGIEKGRLIGHREAVQGRLEEKFGALPASVEDKLQQMSLAELIRLDKGINKAKSLQDLGLDN